VDGDAGGRRHALEWADVAAVDDALDRITGRRRRGVRAVAVVVARGGELAGVDRREGRRAVIASADHLVVAADRILPTRVTDAVPLCRDDRGIGPRLGQRIEARVLRPEAGVDFADDDSLACVRVTAELRVPYALGPGETEEGGRRRLRRGLDALEAVLLDH